MSNVKNKDLTNMKFGRLTVLKITSRPNGVKNRMRYYTCRCDCGNIKVVASRNLITGNTKSCGCLFVESHKGESIVGKKYGKLLVLREVERPLNSKTIGTYFLCVCECGKEKIIARKSLMSKNTKSCGCTLIEYNGKRRKDNTFAEKDDYIICKDSNGRSFHVDIEDYYKIKEYKRYWFVSNRKSPSGNVEAYVETTLKGKVIKLHNFLMNPPDGYIVDHIDGNPKNNRRSNLRICSVVDNAKNKKNSN